LNIGRMGKTQGSKQDMDYKLSVNDKHVGRFECILSDYQEAVLTRDAQDAQVVIAQFTCRIDLPIDMTDKTIIIWQAAVFSLTRGRRSPTDLRLPRV
jgi:hypothetical protein